MALGVLWHSAHHGDMRFVLSTFPEVCLHNPRHEEEVCMTGKRCAHAHGRFVSMQNAIIYIGRHPVHSWMVIYDCTTLSRLSMRTVEESHASP